MEDHDQIPEPSLAPTSLAESSDWVSSVEALLSEEEQELELLERSFQESLERMRQREPEPPEPLTVGERVSDKVASFGGSWSFILASVGVIGAWIMINSRAHAFDPFPFILLNLILSCLAALQAPIIMMSQNRQEAKDRQRAEHDYEINREAEFEVRRLHEKLDHLLCRQMRRLLAIQKLQVELMARMVEHRDQR